jgi:cytochrome c1
MTMWHRAAPFAAAIVIGLVLPGSAILAAEGSKIPAQSWSFSGPFGTYDRAQLQRGYKVYREICSNCHSMRLLSYRNLGEPGGPEFPAATVAAIAAQDEVTDGPNDKGEMFKRPARPSDRFRSPFPNPEAARAANGGALPPDLSVIAKAREGGPDYIHALLTGFRAPPPGFQLAQGMHYNEVFPGHQIAMPPPLSDGVVAYTDGTKPTVDNYAKDVAAYLMWAAEPKLEERHKLGLRVMIFLVVFAGIMYLAKRSVWARLHDHSAERRSHA